MIRSFDSSEDKRQNAFEVQKSIREQKENFIDKKINKLRKDLVYGPISEIHKKMKKKEYKDIINKINNNKKC